MLAKCLRSASSGVSGVVFPKFPSKIGAFEAVRCRGKTSGTEEEATMHHAGPKLSWPRHPQHRLPSAWPYGGLSVTTTAEARSVVVQLDDDGRALLMEQLKKFEDEKTSIAGGSGEVQSSVTTSQLFDVFIFNGLPFIGFGILDNGIMIVAGEYIDVTIGTVLGISTMAAAALGNLISDVAGVGSAGYIENLVSKMGFRIPDITPAQSDLKSVRWTTGLGRAIGISLGCIIGMLPLLFFKNKDDKEEAKSNSESSPASPSV